MFSSVGWDLLEEGTTATQQYPVVLNKTTGDLLTIVRRNEFEHSRATMSVVVQDHTGELHVYCKVRNSAECDSAIKSACSDLYSLSATPEIRISVVLWCF